MKVLMFGDATRAPRDDDDTWWNGVTLTCTECGTVFELEEGDYVMRRYVIDNPMRVDSIFASCPVCFRAQMVKRNT